MHLYIFHALPPTYGLTALQDQTVELNMQGHDILFKQYQNCFNTFLIPILYYKQYLSKATNLIKRVKSKEEFKRLFKEENKKKLRKCHDLVQRAYLEIIRNYKIFLYKDARNAAAGACYSTLKSFIYLLKGTVFSQEANKVKSLALNINILV